MTFETKDWLNRTMNSPVKEKVEFDLCGGKLTMDADLAPVYQKIVDRMEKDGEMFHSILMKMNIKAYRSNDAWIDRKNRQATFFRNDNDKGWHWLSDDEIKPNDLIAIGNVSTGVMVVEVSKVVKEPGNLAPPIQVYYKNNVEKVIDGIKNGKAIKSEYHPPYNINSFWNKFLVSIGIREPYKYPIYKD